MERKWQPQNCSYEDLFEAIHERQMVYNYKKEEIPREDIEKVLEAARWAPSAANIQMWEFIAVDDQETLEELGTWLKKQLDWMTMVDEQFPAHGRAYLDRMPAAIVVAGDIRSKAYFPNVSAYGSGEWEVTNDRYYESIGCCMQNIHLAAKTLGLGTLHLTVEKKYQSNIKKLLNLPEYLEVHNVVPIGIPAWKEPGQDSGRDSLESKLHWDQFDRSYEQSDEEFVKELREHKQRVKRMHGGSQ